MNIFNEAALFRSAMLFFLLSSVFFFLGRFLETEPSGAHFNAAAITLLAIGCVLGTLLWFILLRPVYQTLYRKVVLGESLWRWLWRLLVAAYTLVLIALAKVFADHHIAAVTWLPPSWFPRSQEILTGVYFINLFLFSIFAVPVVVLLLTSVILIVVLVFVTFLLHITTQVIIISIYLAPFFVMLIFLTAVYIVLLAERSGIGRFIDQVEGADPDLFLHRMPRRIRTSMMSTYHVYKQFQSWFSSIPSSHILERFVCSFLSIIFAISAVIFAYHYALEVSFDHVVLLPSFIPNDVAALNRGWGQDGAAVCQDYPKDVWIRFIDDNRIIVAMPGRNQSEDRNFSFIIGTCARDRGW